MPFGSGTLSYEVVENWGQLPEGWDLYEVPAVAVDSQDRVYVFNRGEHPMVVFDRHGHFLTSWGEGVFKQPHGVFIDAEDLIYCVDDSDHTVRKCTPDGKVLMVIGVPGRASDTGYVRGNLFSVQRAAEPFNRPTNLALSPEGDLYVTDGYGNARVHRFSADGKLLHSWGRPGSGPGEFRLVHGICIDRNGTIYVGDRENSRVQVFSPNGEFLTEWLDVYRPNDLFIDKEDRIVIAEKGFAPHLAETRPVPSPEDSYPRVTIRTLSGEILASVSGPDPRAPGGFVSPHAARPDSRGDLYVGEVSAVTAKALGVDRHEFHVIQKFARVAL